jgi:uncharacterized Zn finger protein
MTPYYFNDWYRPSVPKPVKGGIKTKTSRGAIASKWWGKRWISILESFGIGTRLARGRSYARSGQVSKLEITPGQVLASVQGSTAKPYVITIAFKTYSEQEWDKIIAQLNENPLLTAQLLNSVMPEEIEDIFKDLQLPLFPEKQKDLETDCSCPDWSNPCKHIAAVFYLLAEAFDSNPFLLFEIRGKLKAEILDQLQSCGDTPLDQGDLQTAMNEPLPCEEDAFWGKTPTLLGLRSAQINQFAHLPRKLGSISFWQSETDFMTSMNRVYLEASKRAVDIWEKVLGVRG